MLVVEHLGESSLLLVLVVAGLALASVRAAESLLSRARSKADARLLASLAGHLRSPGSPATRPLAHGERAEFATAPPASSPHSAAPVALSPTPAEPQQSASPDSESHRP